MEGRGIVEEREGRGRGETERRRRGRRRGGSGGRLKNLYLRCCGVRVHGEKV
jgi:hypothetical protein